VIGVHPRAPIPLRICVQFVYFIMPVLRKKDISGPALAFVTTTVTDWLPVFESEERALLATLQLRETATIYEVAIMAYAIMPSHLHCALGLKDVSMLVSVMQAYKSLVSRKLNSETMHRLHPSLYEDGRFNLWKRRFDDLIVYSQKQFKTKPEYIHDNPVRAGLVSNAIDWKFSSARDWLLDQRGLIEIDKDFAWLESD